MTKAQIEFLKRRRKAYFKMRGFTYVMLAEEWHVSTRTISTIMNRFPEKKSQALQEAIAKKLSVAYEKLWGIDHHHNSRILTEKKRVVND